MYRLSFLVIIFLIGFVLIAFSQTEHEKDIISTSKGDLEITFLGHGTLMLMFEEKTIHIDPYSQVADYSKLPKADIILITHDHGDHLDPQAIQLVRTEKTNLLLTELCAEKIADGTVMKNGDTKVVQGLKIEAVPAYNIKNTRSQGDPYHKKGEGNGYIIDFGDKRIYIAGDTENTPEMKGLENIHVAFLPMNLPYTMTPEMVADAAKAFMPKILYPYHYGNTDTSIIIELLKDINEIEVRIRKMS